MRFSVASKERTVWLVVTLFLVILTYLVTRWASLPWDGSPGNCPTLTADADIEQAANQWFNSTDSPMPKRDLYQQWKDISAELLVYNGEAKQETLWTHYPEQIALRVFYAPPEIDGFIPNQVNLYYCYAVITTVTVLVKGIQITSERRFDFVKPDGIWKIVWVGERTVRKP
jgi:hypothetical protein